MRRRNRSYFPIQKYPEILLLFQHVHMGIRVGGGRWTLHCLWRNFTLVIHQSSFNLENDETIQMDLAFLKRSGCGVNGVSCK